MLTAGVRHPSRLQYPAVQLAGLGVQRQQELAALQHLPAGQQLLQLAAAAGRLPRLQQRTAAAAAAPRRPARQQQRGGAAAQALGPLRMHRLRAGAGGEQAGRQRPGRRPAFSKASRPQTRGAGVQVQVAAVPAVPPGGCRLTWRPSSNQEGSKGEASPSSALHGATPGSRAALERVCQSWYGTVPLRHLSRKHTRGGEALAYPPAAAAGMHQQSANRLVPDSGAAASRLLVRSTSGSRSSAGPAAEGWGRAPLGADLRQAWQEAYGRHARSARSRAVRGMCLMSTCPCPPHLP